ncbi:MAG: response regulator [Xenococcaceae cyanobacterium MO_188.B29]|nr:response regulator [Xenococcaceae cyanobacterium MO_188.B29]
MRILLVEDDEILQNVLLQSLTSQNHVVDVAEDGELGWAYCESGEYELILLDVGLPELDGISLCERLRKAGYSTPILLMTAKDANHERIRGLDAGADDYLIKPLDLGELHARIRALSRRGEVVPTTVLEIQGLKLDPSSCQVSYKSKPIKVTPKEYSLLELFLRNPARVFSRGQILDRLWTFDDPPQEESVKAHIKGLRKKLKQAGVTDWIENVYGIGYRLNPKISQPEPETPEITEVTESPSNSVEQEFNQKMEQMWQQYQGLMAERMKVLQTAVSVLLKGDLSSYLHHSAETAAHKLAGVLGMFDRQVGTNLAREIETLMQAHQVLPTPEKDRFIALVEDLDSLLALEETETPVQIEKIQKLLLISTEPELGSQLQALATSASLNWKQVNNLDRAKNWLTNNSPYLVVLDIDAMEREPVYLSLIDDLANQTPTIPALVLSREDRLLDRVNVVRAGAAGFLVKPITPAQIWQSVNQLLQRDYEVPGLSDRSGETRVLIVDDDPLFLAAIRPLLEPWGIRMTALDAPLRFWEVLESTNPDLLILDVEMPEINGIELCQTIRSDPNWQSLPILFLTALRDSETIQQVFTAGADDYATKPIIGSELLTRINNRLERNRLLQNLAYKEPITGLMNQLKSSQELESLLQHAQQNHTFFCLVVLRLQDLDRINFKYGHRIGNQVLQRWGRLLQAAFRNNAILGYWGNGEFAIGTTSLTKMGMSDRLGEIMATLRKQIFIAADSDRFSVLCSYALAEYPTDGTTLQSLYQSSF